MSQVERLTIRGLERERDEAIQERDRRIFDHAIQIASHQRYEAEQHKRLLNAERRAVDQRARAEAAEGALQGLYDSLPRYSCPSPVPDGCPVCVAHEVLHAETPTWSS